jgi:hypothetical protein
MILGMTDVRLLDLPGVVESALPEALLAQLPATTAPPPWDCTVRAVVWLQRGTAPLPPGSPYEGKVLPLTMGAFVDYVDSPVGSYREVFAGPLVRRAGRPSVHIPFIAVDSLPSVHGGRAHWGLPKACASFDGDVDAGTASATGDGWSVRAEASTTGLALPLVGMFSNAQAGGRAAVVLRGRGRLARVRVTASGPTLSGWIGEGTHLGVVATGRMVVHPAEPA